MPETVAAERRDPATEGSGGVSAVLVRGLRRDYGERVALRDVSVELEAGETLAVIGPNGAGKTTLLRVLATLLRPSAGEVCVLGCSLPREAWRLRGRIGYLGHEPLLYRDLTVAENLEFHARLNGLDDSRGRIAEVLGLVGLERRAGELVRNLSAGLVQRAAACRAIVHEPELLLLDEPGSHLDPEAASLLQPLIGRSAGRTRVLVSHDVEPALAEAARVVALRADGSPAYQGPASGLSPGDARAIYGRSA